MSYVGSCPQRCWLLPWKLNYCLLEFVIPFSCPSLASLFVQNAQQVHFRTHLEDKPYVCQYCSRGFREKGSLVRHIRHHTGEKPFKCYKCGRGFAEHGTLNRHLKTKGEVAKLVCVVGGGVLGFGLDKLIFGWMVMIFQSGSNDLCPRPFVYLRLSCIRRRRITCFFLIYFNKYFYCALSDQKWCWTNSHKPILT